MSVPKSKILAITILGLNGIIYTLCAADVVPKGYMSLDGGVTRAQDTVVHDSLGNSTPVAFDSGLRFDLRFGVRSPIGFGAEIDFGVLYNQVKMNPLFPSGGKLDLYQVPIMLNAFYSFRVLGPLRIQLGGGIGAV